MYLFATEAFFEYDGNDLDVKARQGRVTTMHRNGRQLLPCIEWSDVPGAAKPTVVCDETLICTSGSRLLSQRSDKYR